MTMAIAIGALGAVALAAVAFAMTRRTARQAPGSAAARPAAPADRDAPPEPDAEEPPAYVTAETQNVFGECFKLAFGVARFDYQIVGEHARVLANVDAAVDESVGHREYFPRRPRQLPKLLQAINDSESTRQELVRLILEDPALADSVLKRANSAFYRPAAEPIESLDRAVVLLGTDGLRALMATAILQPVFRLPKGYFDTFADATWMLGERSAICAEALARHTRSADPFVAQLLGLLSALGSIVLFRLAMDKYREFPDVLPRAEVFIRALESNRARIACLIGESWELSEGSLAALEEQRRQVSPVQMSPLGRAIYYGELCGALMQLRLHGSYSKEGAQALLQQQGLERDTVYALWHAAKLA